MATELMDSTTTWLTDKVWPQIAPHLDFPQFGELIDMNTNFSTISLWHDSFYLVPIYIVAVFFLTRYYSDAEGRPVASKLPIWKPIMVLYNLTMSLFSAYSFYVTAKWMAKNKLYDQEVCPAGNAYTDPEFGTAVFLFFMSKYVEFADTLFLIVKGKKVIFLHWFHHINAALDMGFIFVTGFEAAWIFLLLNGFIHTIMYFYYLCSLLKIRLPGKPIITMGQLTQFFVGFTFVWFYKYEPCVKESANFTFAYVYNYAFVGVLVMLFANFFVKSYCLKGKKKSVKGVNTKKDV